MKSFKSSRLLSVGLRVALAVALLAIVSSGCGSPSVKAEVARVSSRAIEETVMVAGNVQSANPVQVIPQVMGSVGQVFASDGQEVAAGQPLVQLDTSDLEQALLSARASLETAQAISGMFSSLSSAASGIGSSFNSLLNSVDSGVNGLFTLEKTLIPALPEDQRMVALQAIEASYQSYQASRSQAQPLSVGGGDGGVSTGASQAAANKAIQNAQKNLKQATITAPVAGTLVTATTGGMSMEGLMGSLMSSFSSMIPSGLNLSSLSGMTGSMANMGLPTSGPLGPGSFIVPGTPVYTIVDLKNMSMVAKVDETDLPKIETGQTATATLESYPGKQLTGKVIRVANTSTTNEAGATAFEVTIQLDRPDINLKIGMTGTADVTVATKKAAAVVPVEAIVEKKGKKYVFKVVDGKARLKQVTLGLVTESSVEIAEGVKIGDKVVVKGVEKLKDGQGVKT